MTVSWQLMLFLVLFKLNFQFWVSLVVSKPVVFTWKSNAISNIFLLIPYYMRQKFAQISHEDKTIFKWTPTDRSHNTCSIFTFWKDTHEETVHTVHRISIKAYCNKYLYISTYYRINVTKLCLLESSMIVLNKEVNMLCMFPACNDVCLISPRHLTHLWNCR